MYEIYEIARLYTDSDNNLQPSLLVTLAGEFQQTILTVLQEVAYIHSGFSEVFNAYLRTLYSTK